MVKVQKKQKTKKKDIRKLCVLCKDTGKGPCYSCDGKGEVYVSDKP